MSAEPSEMAVLFADVCGSTRLYETLGDAAALAAIDGCLRLVSAACDSYGGRLVKTIGDEAMVVFASADGAAQAAADAQARMSAAPPVGGQRLSIRVGFHFGPTLSAGGDVFGDSVNIAARLVGVAHGAQIITSVATASALSPWLRERTREVAALTVKGKSHDIEIAELVCQDETADLTTLSTRVRTSVTRLSVRHAGREVMLDDSRALLTLGRDAQNDVVIADRMASRMHAHIERRRDRYVLVDHSSNGTFLTIDGQPEIELRREEVTLRGTGRIAFGHAHTKEPGESVDYACGV